ncbi:hypothetical protein SAMN05192559_10495 [Halobacillus karajensis]|nr:hypothetical protein SAMN05192559_10495 [Halobacillus karajensis]
MTEITPKILEEFKRRMHISHNEDENLKHHLSFSYKAIQRKCGPFDILAEEQGKELVFERARYAYNDALEYFDDNFLSELNSFGLALAFAAEEETDETI